MNLIPEILTDKEFEKLTELKLLNFKAIRDYKIIKKYSELRVNHNAGRCIEILAREYPELKQDTLRKMIYQSGITKYFKT